MPIARARAVCVAVLLSVPGVVTRTTEAIDNAATHATPSAAATTSSSAAGTRHQHSANVDYYASGDLERPSAAHTEAALLLMGGGVDVDAALRWFIARAGGGHLLILRAAGSDSYHKYLLEDLGGIASVETLVFHNRAAASDPQVLATIAHADGLFIAGGDQANYLRDWKGTPVQAAIEQHLRAGKPLGGSSAGLAILGRYSYGALDGGSVESIDALQDPLGGEITLETDFLHLPYLDNVIADSHFSARQRLGRLIAFVARLTAQEKRSHLYGLGIDENTALCIEADGTARVYSGSRGRAWLVMPQHAPSVLRPGKPLSIEDVRIVGLDAQSALDFKTFAVEQPASSRIATVRNGELTQH